MRSALRRPGRRLPRAVLTLPVSLAAALSLTVPAAAADEVPTGGGIVDAPVAVSQENPTEVPVGDATPRAETGNIAPPAASPFAADDPGPAPERATVAEEVNPDVPGLPDGVDVLKEEWKTDRWVIVSVTSPAMGGEVEKVQLHLPRDWYKDPGKTYPSILMLGGLWGSEKENSWSYRTRIVDFFADKNVTLILPIGGSGSFYSDWEQPDNGQNYKWETFLTKELPPVLNHWRIRDDHRAVVGVSMGATSAVNLAARNPEMFDAVGSFSGYLDTTSLGLPQLFAANLKSSGFDATRMWGPYYSRNWREHDPKLLVRNLKGKVVYVSAGTGTTGSHDKPNDKPGFLNNPREFGSRVTSQNFVNAAKLAGVHINAVFRPNGTHTWAYWEPEMKNMWPMIAEQWGMKDEDTSASCTVEGAFREAVERDRGSKDFGECVTNVYDGPNGGKIQDFEGARFFQAPDTDVAYAQWGRTGALYSAMGGPASWLGYPLREEGRLSQGVWVRYEGGRIHYYKDYGAVAVKNDIVSAWGSRDYERGMGYPTAAEVEVLDADGTVIGQSQTFEQGTFYRNGKTGQVFSLKGGINQKYVELGGPAGQLGFPTRNDRDGLDDEGSYSRFENGYIYSSPRTGAHVMYNGPVFEAWKKEGYEHPEGIGYPSADDVADPTAQRVITFERGSIHVAEGGTATVARFPAPEVDPAQEQDPEALGVPVSEGQVPGPAR